MRSVKSCTIPPLLLSTVISGLRQMLLSYGWRLTILFYPAKIALELASFPLHPIIVFFGTRKHAHNMPLTSQVKQSQVTLKWLLINKSKTYLKNVCKLNILDYVSFRSCSKPLRNVDHLTLDVPFSRTDVFKNSFFVRICHLWNDLPLGIRESNTLSIFR